MSQVVLSVVEVALLLRESARAVRKACNECRLQASLQEGNGGPQYRIALDSLPPEAQHRYWAQQLRARPPSERRAAFERMNFAELEEREVARLAGVTRRPRPLAPLPPTMEESYQRQLEFEKRPAWSIEEGRRRAQIMLGLSELDANLPMLERYQIAVAGVAEECNEAVSVRTLRRWHKLIRHLPYHDWAAALAPAWSGGRQKAEICEQARQFVLSEWAIQSQPALLPIYRRARREAAKHGWTLPSYKTVLRLVNALPATTKAFTREGDEALDLMYPSIRRDYSTLNLHDLWVSDGRKADVFCIWPDGYVGRPITMAWQELRTRKVLGWAVGKVENAELARLSFRDAAERSAAIPSEVYLDNGRAYASKQMTGGQATRNRFTINADDPHGLLTLFAIKAIWATPYNGRAKPIESYWNTIAQAERCAAFAGSYCGNKPDAKPEEFRTNKQVPIAHYLGFLQEAIEEKNARPHRGDSMDGRSPDSLYAELIATTLVRQPSADQLRLCLMAAEQVTLDKAHGFTVLGNRYWSEQLAKLEHRGPFTVRYDPENLSAAVAVYDGSTFLCEAPLWSKTGFRDMAAAKDHQRERSRFKRAQKDQALSAAAMNRAERSWEIDPPEIGAAAKTKAMPTAKVAQLVRPVLAIPTPRSSLQSTADSEQEMREFRAMRDKGMDQLAQQRKRAAGGN